jgi:hypothetical protein
VLGEETRDRRRKAASPRIRQDEVTDLDDLALAVEVVQRGSADNLAVTGVDGRQSQQPPFSARIGRSWIEAARASRSKAGRFPASRISGSVNARRIASTSPGVGKRRTTPPVRRPPAGTDRRTAVCSVGWLIAGPMVRGFRGE